MSEQLVSVDEFLSARKAFTKSGDILVKASKAPTTWNPETRSARFVMSAEIEDRDRDVILQAGLNLTEFLKNPVAPLQHRSSGFPVGQWKDVEQILNGRPKRTEGTLVLVEEGVDEDADRLARHIAAGTIRACSIGFIPKTVVKREIPEDKRTEGYYWPGYEIREAELVECSPVTIPAHPAALAKMAADGDVIAREILEDVLDNWVKHPETGLIMPRAEFEAAHKEATGERTTVVLPPSPETDVGAKGTPSPDADAASTGPRERSLVRRTLEHLLQAFAPENEAKLTNAVQAAAAEMEEQEREEAARKAAAEIERKALEDECAAVEEALLKHGIMESAA